MMLAAMIVMLEAGYPQQKGNSWGSSWQNQPWQSGVYGHSSGKGSGQYHEAPRWFPTLSGKGKGASNEKQKAGSPLVGLTKL